MVRIPRRQTIGRSGNRRISRFAAGNNRGYALIEVIFYLFALAVLVEMLSKTYLYAVKTKSVAANSVQTINHGEIIMQAIKSDLQKSEKVFPKGGLISAPPGCDFIIAVQFGDGSGAAYMLSNERILRVNIPIGWGGFVLPGTSLPDPINRRFFPAKASYLRISPLDANKQVFRIDLRLKVPPPLVGLGGPRRQHHAEFTSAACRRIGGILQ